MPCFVVLLRGVNVGKANRVPMAAFKSLLEGLGYTNVSTLLNSGNAVFSSTGRSAAQHSSAIADALMKSLGFSVVTVVKSGAELAAIVAASPIAVPESEHAKFLVAFATESSSLEGLEVLQSLTRLPERLVVGEEAAYLYCASGIHESKVAAALRGNVGKAVTTRNWATVRKLAALCNARAD